MAGTNPVFEDFQKIAEILIRIRDRVDLKTDVVWAGFDNPKQLIDELSIDIKKIRECDAEALSKIYTEFLPTCTYQELAMTNGWGNDYLKLADQFDYYHKKIRAVMPAIWRLFKANEKQRRRRVKLCPGTEKVVTGLCH
jgi:hypothetical protein